MRLTLFLGFALLILELNGCGFLTWARLSINEPINAEDVAFIIPGTTTFDTIRRHLGAPSGITGLKDDGAVASYSFRDAKYFRADLAWPLRFILPVSPEFGQSSIGPSADVFQVVFDNRWVVRSYAFSTHQQASRFRTWPFDF